MGNLCVSREDSPEEDRRAYEAYRQQWTEVRATLNDQARLESECSQSFRIACADRGVSQLSKPLLQEMTNHFVRRLSCDNPRMVQSIHQHLETMCPGNAPISQETFTEFTRAVLIHIERDLREKLEKLQQKYEGYLPPMDSRVGAYGSQRQASADARPRGQYDPHAEYPSAGRPPDTVSTPQYRPPLSEALQPDDRRPLGYSGPPPDDRRPPPQLSPPQQQPVVYAAPADPVKPMSLAAQQRLQPYQAPAPQKQSSQPQQPSYASSPGTSSPAPGAGQAGPSRSTLDLLPGTGTFPEPTKGGPAFEGGQPTSVQLVGREDVEVTFGKEGAGHAGNPPVKTFATAPPQTEAPPGAAPLTWAQAGPGAEQAMPEYHAQSLEEMKREILCGNLRVQVYNQNFVLEVKRLALNARMQLIAIFGDDGNAVASFEIRDLQCITQGIASSIMDPSPPAEVSVAFRFKDRFLCVVFDRPDICYLALQAFSNLCQVEVELA